MLHQISEIPSSTQISVKTTNVNGLKLLNISFELGCEHYHFESVIPSTLLLKKEEGKSYLHFTRQFWIGAEAVQESSKFLINWKTNSGKQL